MDISTLEECAALETATARLACFEAVVADYRAMAAVEPEKAPESQEPESGLEPMATAPARVAAVIEPAVEGADLPESVSAPVTAPSADPAAGRPPVADGAAADVAVQTPPVATATATNSRPADSASIMEGWGVDEDAGPESVQATVVNVTKTRLGALVFHFDNGQVWRQQEKRFFSYPREREFDVIISKGMMGGYRLQVVGAGRKVGIERLQ